MREAIEHLIADNEAVAKSLGDDARDGGADGIMQGILTGGEQMILIQNDKLQAILDAHK